MGGARADPRRRGELSAPNLLDARLAGDVERLLSARGVPAQRLVLEITETITGAELDTLERLVAKSLLVRHQHADAPTRLAMLETVRAYAGERFAASADRDAVEERHHRYYGALAEQHGSEHALCGRNREQHLARLDADIDNLHAALRWALDKRSAEDALALVAALGWYWVIRDRYADAVHWIDQAFSIPGAEHFPELRARALLGKDLVLWELGRSAEQAAVVGELDAISIVLADPVITSQVLRHRAHFEHVAGRLDAADALADEAIRWAKSSGDRWEIANLSYEKAIQARTISELRDRADRAASLLEEVGNTYVLASLFVGALYVALRLGGDRDALELAERALPIVREHGTPNHWTVLCGNVGLAALMTGDTDRASDAFREELTLCRELVILPLAQEGLSGLAALAALRRDDDRAARLTGAAAAHRYGDPDDAVDAKVTATGRCRRP